MKQILFIVIVIILLFSIYGSFNLSMVDFHKKNICPKVLGIPACYIVLLFFILGLAGHVFKEYLGRDLWYYGFIAVPFLLALGGSLTELSGKVICPRTPDGTPMCFISLGICTTLLILKYTEIRLL